MLLLLAVTLPTGIAAIIVALAIGYTALALVLQRKLSHPKKMRHLQNRSTALSKELREMMKNKASQEEMAKKQKELMPLMSESMKTNMKPMLVVLPLFFLVWYVLLPMAFAQYSAAKINFIVPLGYKGLFFIVLFVGGMISSISIMIYDRKKAKEEAAAENLGNAEFKVQQSQPGQPGTR